MLARRVVRALVRLAVLLTLASVLVFVGDLFLDFLPSSLQTRLPLHPEDPIVVDLKLEHCIFDKNCPQSGPIWKRVPKELHLGHSWTQQTYLYYREIPEPELPAGQEVIVKVATGEFDPKLPGATLPNLVYDDLMDVVENVILLSVPSQAIDIASKHGWRLIDKKAGLWAKYAKHQPNQAVTKIKVLFGESAEYPLPHWTLTDDGLNLGRADLRPRIAYKIGHSDKVARPVLRFNETGTFKIAQLADPHMSTNYGACDHPVPALAKDERCLADIRTTQFVDSILDEERPDMIVFTGDQIFGQTSPDPETALLKALAPAIVRKIPYAVVWGNHDDQGPLPNSELMNIVSQLPYSISSAGPEDVPGDSNYYLTVAPHSSDYPALTMFFVDSHAKLGTKDNAYDYIRPEQHDFLRDSADTIRQRQKGYSHIPLSMAFFHIPLIEFADGWDSPPDIPRIGEQREGVASPKYNSGTLKVLRDIGVSVVAVGHDHVNDFCQLQPATEDEASQEKLWLCYGGSYGWGAYGGYPDAQGHDFKRRLRFFEVNMNVPTIDTWHRVQDESDVANRARLVENGKASYRAPAKLGHHRNSEERILVEDGGVSAQENGI